MMNFINRFMRLFRRRTVNIGRDVQLLGNTIIGCDCSFSARVIFSNSIIKSKVFTIYTTLTISFIFFESSLLMLIYFVAEILNPQFTNIAK